MAAIQAQRGSYQEALGNFEKSLRLNQEIRNRYGEAETYNDLGFFYRRRGDFAKALEAYGKALDIGNDIQAAKTIWEAQYGSGQAFEQQGRLAEAITRYKDAINTVESLRAQLQLDEQRLTFFEGKVKIYKSLIHALMTSNVAQARPLPVDEIFQCAEKAKARALLDMLTEAKVDLAIGVDHELAQRQNGIFHAVAKIQTSLRNDTLTAEEKKNLFSQLAAEENKLAAVRLELKKKNPAYFDLNYREPVTIQAAQQRLLDEQHALLEFIVGDDSSYLLLITQARSEIFRLPSEQELEPLLEKYFAWISHQPGAGPEQTTLGKKLYDILLRPIEGSLPKDAHLIILPDGKLSYLPFEALIADLENNTPRYAVANFTMSYAPSAAVLDFIASRKKASAQNNGKRLLAFGDPIFETPQENSAPSQNEKQVQTAENWLYRERGFALERLPFTAVEVQRIAKNFPPDQVRIHLREKATEEQIKTEKLDSYNMIHFASHALLDEEHPSRSCVVLTQDDDQAEDGFLQAPEIMNMRLQAELVTLSACQTAKGRMVRGEGLLGLTRAFSYAGAESVLGSLWAVNDRFTAELMEKFYFYLRQGKTKAEALRQAKLELLNGNVAALRHPYHWAGFVLSGKTR